MGALKGYVTLELEGEASVLEIGDHHPDHSLRPGDITLYFTLKQSYAVFNRLI